MRAVQVTRHGGPEVLELVELPAPEPGQGQVLVDVAAAGVNYIDTYHRTGAYPTAPPFVPGVEGSGRVREVGPGVEGIAPGDRVAWKDATGSYAEQAVVPAGELVPVPDAVDDETAAALLLQGLTAHYLVTSTYPVQPGDTVLVHAAAGGVGLLLTQLVTLIGGRVLATVSTPEKAALAREAGAAEVLDYADFPAQVQRLTSGAGVAAAYDGVGAATFDGSIDSLRRRGFMVLFGAASGPVPPVDPQLLNRKGSLYLTRPTLAHYTATAAELGGRAQQLFDWIADGRLDVRIGHRYPLGEARTAHEDLEGRRTTGKLILLTGEG